MDIVRFKGGLGNQMYQYAFLKSLENRKREVGASLGYYHDFPDTRGFVLDKVFHKLSMKIGYDDLFMAYYQKWRETANDKAQLAVLESDLKNRYFWNESDTETGNYQENVYRTSSCVFVGYWQSYKYFENIRAVLTADFEFSEGEDCLVELHEKLKSGNWISVHIRRGDYLDDPDIYGGICTEAYYQDAISMMKRLTDYPRFIFFSDDINWVEQNYNFEGAVYVKPEMFDTYEDWYDMSLMTKCRGNIIANSSFSWWGAWLNTREDKIVIAPSKWSLAGEFRDICPVEWIRL